MAKAAPTAVAKRTAEKIDEDGVVTKVDVAELPSEFGAVDKARIKVTRQVTLPVVSWSAGQVLTCQIVGKIFTGKEMTGERGGKAIMKPANLMHIKGVAGSLRQIVVGSVLESELNNAYPDGGYVGKWFSMLKVAPNVAKEKRYATYQILEIANPTA